MTLFKNMDDLIHTAKRLGMVNLVIPAAESDSAIGAAVEGRKAGLVHGILIGNRQNIEERIRQAGESPSDYEIIESSDDVASAQLAVELVREEKADYILKGSLKTGDLMRAVLNKERGLHMGKLVSDVMITEDPVAGGRLIGLTDGGLNVAPDLKKKKLIIENAVAVFQRLGFKRPKVACLSAIEIVQKTIPSTLDAKALTDMCLAGEIENCDVYGPLALDNALSIEAARAKNIENSVAGRADILLMPNIESGNVLGKSFTYFAKQDVGHVIEGARAPVLIPSRVESIKDKLCSIAIGAISVHALKAGSSWPTEEFLNSGD